MPVLGFSHGRCSAKPKDLHIRKVSFSGSSLSSGSSFTSSSSNSIAYACSSASSQSSLSMASPTRPPLDGHVDPLAQHPTYCPPPRLHERPLLDTGLFLGGAEEDDVSRLDKELPSLPCYVDEPRQYSSARPQFPCSRWSDSTIASVDLSDCDSVVSGSYCGSFNSYDIGSVDSDSSDDVDEPLDPVSDDVEDPIHLDHDVHHYHFQQSLAGHHSMPNFSYKRDTALPKRPPIKTLDSLDEFVKRGGWKRRGIIFHNEEMTDSVHLDL